MPYLFVLQKSIKKHHITIRSSTRFNLLISTCSVVCLLPRAYSNTFLLAALEKERASSLFASSLRRKGMVIIMKASKESGIAINSLTRKVYKNYIFMLKKEIFYQEFVKVFTLGS